MLTEAERYRSYVNRPLLCLFHLRLTIDLNVLEDAPAFSTNVRSLWRSNVHSKLARALNLGCLLGLIQTFAINCYLATCKITPLPRPIRSHSFWTTNAASLRTLGSDLNRHTSIEIWISKLLHSERLVLQSISDRVLWRKLK